MSGEGEKTLEFPSGVWSLQSYEEELKRMIKEDCKSVQATTVMERWLKVMDREEFEDPAKLKVVVQKLNEDREDVPTPADETGSDPSSSSDSGSSKSFWLRKARGGSREKEELKKRLLQVKADENMAERLQQQESEDPQKQQMTRREDELLELQEAAQERRRNVVRKVKAQASVPSSSESWDESEQKEKEKDAEKAEAVAEEGKTTVTEEENEKTAVAEEEKTTVAEEEKTTVAEEEKTAVAEESVNMQQSFAADDPPSEEMSIADACREAYRLTDKTIEGLLEEDKVNLARNALEVLESKVQNLPDGYGAGLEKLGNEFETFTKDLRDTADQTEEELEENLVKRDGAMEAREAVLTRKVEAELKR